MQEIKWVSDCCWTQQFYQYHGENKLIFNENWDADKVHFAPDQHA